MSHTFSQMLIKRRDIMLKRWIYVLALAVAVASIAPAVHAAHLYGPEGLDTTYGFYHRLRHETWDNSFDFSDDAGLDDANLWRFKTSLWLKSDYEKKWGFKIKLTNEARYYMEHHRGDEGWDEDEIIFDNLYFYMNDAFGLPLDISVGRQDFLFTFGEGFLIMDGTPEDGSRSFYFNAAKINWAFTSNYSVDLVYISNPQKDDYLPSLYSADKKALNASDEQGVVVYGRLKINDQLNVEPYYMWKEEENDPTFNDELDIHTLGARVVYTFGAYKLRFEYCHQFGEYENQNALGESVDRNAGGGYVFIGRSYKNITWTPSWELGAVYLTGDDPDTTDEDEGFDPLFSRWPWLSESFVFMFAPERGVNYRTNLQLYRIGLGLTFTPQTSLNMRYNYVLANEERTTNPFASGTDDDRGHLTQATVKHVFSKNIDGYLMVEHLIPGDHYVFDDTALFVRWQLQFKY